MLNRKDDLRKEMTHMSEFITLFIPFAGTTLGAACVFFMKNGLNEKLEKILLGFAAGVMIAASVWSLLIPSIDMAVEQGKIGWMPALVGFLLGIVGFEFNQQVEDFEIQPDNGERKRKCRNPFILLGELVFDGLLNLAEVNQKEQRRENNSADGHCD